MDSRLTESMWTRGWRDTKRGWHTWPFLLWEVGVCPLIGLLIGWQVSPGTGALVTTGLVLTGIVGIWVGATASAPFKQRNEVRREVTKPGQDLEVIIKECRFVLERRPRTVLAVDVLFKPRNPPIQLASIVFLFENAEHPALEMPTHRIELDQRETFLFDVSGASVGLRLIRKGYYEGKGIWAPLTEEEWPKACLHIVAGALDFKTEPFLAPTPTKPLKPHGEGSRPQVKET